MGSCDCFNLQNGLYSLNFAQGRVSQRYNMFEIKLELTDVIVLCGNIH